MPSDHRTRPDPPASKRSTGFGRSSGGMSEPITAATRLPRPLVITPAALTFEGFFDTESPVLFRRLCLLTGNRSEAEDVMQDAFLRLWERWDRVAAMEDPTGYLYRTAMNVFRSRYRRARLAARRAAGLAPRDEYAEADARRTVTRALGTLTPRQRAAVVLTDLIGFSSEEAGHALGVKASTVRALATQGRETLRRTMEPER